MENWQYKIKRKFQTVKEYLSTGGTIQVLKSYLKSDEIKYCIPKTFQKDKDFKVFV